MDNPLDESPDADGLTCRVGVHGPAAATPADVLHALEHGEFFRLLDGDSNAYHIGRCWSSNGTDSRDLFGPLDDFGRADVGAVTIQYRHHGRWIVL
jgi:hypothetical protein